MAGSTCRQAIQPLELELNSTCLVHPSSLCTYYRVHPMVSQPLLVGIDEGTASKPKGIHWINGLRNNELGTLQYPRRDPWDCHRTADQLTPLPPPQLIGSPNYGRFMGHVWVLVIIGSWEDLLCRRPRPCAGTLPGYESPGHISLVGNNEDRRSILRMTPFCGTPCTANTICSMLPKGRCPHACCYVHPSDPQ